MTGKGMRKDKEKNEKENRFPEERGSQDREQKATRTHCPADRRSQVWKRPL